VVDSESEAAANEPVVGSLLGVLPTDWVIAAAVSQTSRMASIGLAVSPCPFPSAREFLSSLRDRIGRLRRFICRPRRILVRFFLVDRLIHADGVVFDSVVGTRPVKPPLGMQAWPRTAQAQPPSR
jgi:hypothetical protein